MSEDEALAIEDEVSADPEAKEKDLLTRLKESIEVEVEELGALRRKVSVTVPRGVLDEQLDEQYGELSRDAIIPGFRKGRAPRRLIEKRYGREVTDQIRSKVLGQGYLAAVEKAEIKAVSDPMVWVPSQGDGEDPAGAEQLVSVKEALQRLPIPSEGDLRFSCEVEIQPAFELPKLDKIPLKKPKVGISDKDVQEQIDRLRAMRGTYESAEGKIKADDLVIADVKMSVGGEVVEEQENMQLAARGQTVFGVALGGLGEVLVGKKAGQTVSAQGEIPDDYNKTEQRGKPASFEIVVHESKRLVLPPINKSFLSQIGFESEKELRKWVRDDLESRLGEAIQEGLRNQVYQHLLDNTKMDLPEGLSSRQTDRVVSRRLLDLRRKGVSDSEIEKHLDELRTGARDEAATQLKASFIMDEIAEEVDVHVAEDEVNARIARIAARYNRRFDRVRDDLSKGEGLSSLYIQIRDDKIIDQLIGDALITETEGPAETSEEKSKSKAGHSTGKTTAKESKPKTKAKTTADPPKKKATAKKKTVRKKTK